MSDTPHPQLVLDILPGTEPSFQNFVVGANQEAVSALQQLAPGRAVYLWGSAGCGRSHLLRAAAGATEGAVCCTPNTPAADLFALSQAPLPPLISIDDVHLLDAQQQSAVFALYNQWRASAATTRASRLVLAGDRAPLQMPLREDLRTRLGWDLTFRLELLSDTDKRAALQAHANSRSLNVPTEILDWLLTHHARDMRRLNALIDALDHYSLATKRPITLPLLKTLLAEPAFSANFH